MGQKIRGKKDHRRRKMMKSRRLNREQLAGLRIADLQRVYPPAGRRKRPDADFPYEPRAQVTTGL